MRNLALERYSETRKRKKDNDDEENDAEESSKTRVSGEPVVRFLTQRAQTEDKRFDAQVALQKEELEIRKWESEEKIKLEEKRIEADMQFRQMMSAMHMQSMQNMEQQQKQQQQTNAMLMSLIEKMK